MIGAGPAGLMAAEAASARGVPVAIYDHMPSPARKLLMAGKSGLNVTKREDAALFRAAYGAAAAPLARALDRFGPADVAAWMEGLGEAARLGSTGRVFPLSWKASPLLRRWLARLDARGVALHRRHRWRGWDADGALRFDAPDGPVALRPAATVLALGGASWRRLGSDGAWAGIDGLAPHAAPFAPANAGVAVDWSEPVRARHLGAPVKGVRLRAGALASRGEVAITAKGLEGGGLYPLTPALREGHPLLIDLKPDLDADAVARRLARPRGKLSRANHLRRALKLAPVHLALLREWGSGDDAREVKRLPVRHGGLRPLDEAISTAGGLRLDALDADLMLRDRPGTFAAGEMLDWEAPTGGYLLTAALATGRLAGEGAAAWAGP